MADQELPLSLSIAPFPEGFQGDMDETFQQAYQNTTAKVSGNFLTGLVLPPGSTLPTSDQGPIAMNETWYFWDSTTGQYVPQGVNQKVAKNFCRNSCYLVAQQGTSFTIGAGISPSYDMAQVRSTLANILAIAPGPGAVASADNDYIPGSMKYTVGPNLVASPSSSDLYCHEHLLEGIDIGPLQGQTTSLSFTINTNTPGTYSVYLANNGRDQSYVANFTITNAQVNTPVRVKISGIPAFPTTGTWNYGEGVTGLYIGIVFAVGTQWQTAAPKQWNSGFFAGTAQNINMCSVLNNQMQISAIKFEAAAGPTYYQTPTFDADYESVLRYFFTTFSYQSVTGGVPIMGVSPATNQGMFMYTFPRRMCKTPNVVPWSAAGTPAAGNVTNISTGTSYAAATLSAVPKGIYAQVTTGITATKADLFGAFIKADARLS